MLLVDNAPLLLGCQESEISIDSTLSYIYDNGLSGDTGAITVCHKGKEMYVCNAEDSYFGFNVEQAITDLCQYQGYNCESK